MPRLQDWLVEALNGALAGFAPEYATDPKQAIFRIYRDTRFSPDKTPYKTNIGIQFRHERGDDVHAGQFGRDCARCHDPRRITDPLVTAALALHVAGFHDVRHDDAFIRALQFMVNGRCPGRVETVGEEDPPLRLQEGPDPVPEGIEALLRHVGEPERENHGIETAIGAPGEGILQEELHALYANGVRVYIDANSVPLISGSQIDYVDTLMGAGFTVNNPNAVSGCGCARK